jgi:ribosome hibernation promoting factor
MQLRITARHFDLTPEVRKRATDAFDHLTKFFDRIVAADLFITMEKNRYDVEFKISVSREVITAGAESHDLRAALDQCAERAKTQLVRYKGKLKEKKPAEISELSASLSRPNSDEDEIDV